MPGSIDQPMSVGRLVVHGPVDTAGLRIRVEAHSRQDMDLVARVVGHHETDPGSAELTISIGGRTPEPPSGPADFVGPYGDHWFQGSRQYFHHHWGMDAAITSDRVEMGGQASGYRRWVAVRNAMLFVLAHAFAERGSWLLHAGAIHSDGRTFLLLGDSGAGKSTLAYAASQAGWDLMADDMVVVRAANGVLSAQGVPRVPSIPAELVDAAHRTGSALPGDDRNRIELTGLQLDGSRRDITGVLLAGHGGTAAELAEVDGPAVLEALLEALVLASVEPRLRDWFPPAARLSGMPRARILHARDPRDRVVSAARLLDRLESTSGDTG